MKMSSKVYDVLKWMAMFFLPALAVLVNTVFGIWKIPYGNEISDTIVAVNAMLAMCLGISCVNYKKTNEQEDNK